MAAYRFCRTDDVPRLVEAYNSCYVPHFDGEPQLTVERFKTAAKEIDLWASSCMLATDGATPIGVLLASKRDTATLIHRLGIHAGQQRQGHGGHLLDSLSQKLAILGPPRLVAEVPASWSAVRAFFESCGYRAEAAYTDLVLDGPVGEVDAGELAVPVTLAELRESGMLVAGVDRSWGRSLETLAAQEGRIAGLAVASDLRIEAYLLHRRGPDDSSREIVAIGCAAGEQSTALLGILVRQFASQEGSPVVVPGISAEEFEVARLQSWGFQKTGESIRYASEAVPA